jgi:hypothetical protein
LKGDHSLENNNRQYKWTIIDYGGVIHAKYIFSKTDRGSFKSTIYNDIILDGYNKQQQSI